jgi:hypothetical protein
VRRPLVLAAAAAALALAVVAPTLRWGADAPPASASAVEILRGAARAEGGASARPDQFLYTRSVESALSSNEATGEWRIGKPQEREQWIAVDGARAGLMRRSSGDGPAKETQLEPGLVLPPDLPAEATAVRAYLDEHGSDTKYTQGQGVFTLAADLLRTGAVPPQMRAALFEALATVPGVANLGRVEDALGRPADAVALDFAQGWRVQLLFAPDDRSFLGSQEVRTTAADGVPAGTVTDDFAVDVSAVVDAAGDRP